MSVNDEIQRALSLVAQGRRSQARMLLLAIDPLVTDPAKRLYYIDVALNTLDPVQDSTKKLALSKEAIRIASNLNEQDHLAYFKGRAAELATMEITTRWYRATMLKLAPGWLEFATESDKSSYDKIVKEVDELDRQIDEDLAQAITLSQEIEDVRVRAAVLMAKARVDFSRYLLLKGKCVQTPFRSLLWKYEFMHHPFWEALLLLPNGDARKLSSLLRAVRSSHLEAAKLFDAVSDNSAATAYLNLANDLRTAHHFRAARKYLTMARSRAQKYGDQAVLRRADLVERSIKAKNRDTPHYEKGQSRDLDAM